MRLVLAIFILALAATLQTVLAAEIGIYIDFLFVSLICCALQLGELPTLAVAIMAGILKDSFSACIFCHSVAVFVAIGLIISKLRHLLFAGHWTTQFGLAFAGTLAAWVLYNILLKVWGLPVEAALGFTLKSAILNACVAPVVFKIWRAILQ